MAYIQPSGYVSLCKGVNISADSQDQLFFENEGQQRVFFTSKAFVTVPQVQFVRGTVDGGVIKVPLNFHQCHDVNYMFFANVGFSEKRYYACVTGVEYVSNDCTALTYKLDNIQTWMWETNWDTISMVEREHTDNDDLYMNKVNEDISPGEMETRVQVEIDDKLFVWDKALSNIDDYTVKNKSYIIVQADFDVEKWCKNGYTTTKDTPSVTVTDYPIGTAYVREDGVIDSYGLYAIPLNFYFDIPSGTQGDILWSDIAPYISLDKTIATNKVNDNYYGAYLFFANALQINGWNDHILNMWIYPASLIEVIQATVPSDLHYENMCYTVTKACTKDYMGQGRVNEGLFRQIDLPSYTDLKDVIDSYHIYMPKNKKCFNYPYTQYLVTNNNGSAIELKPEQFVALPTPETFKPKMRVLGTSSVDNRVRLVPLRYNSYLSGIYDNDYGIDSAPLQSMSLRGDAYNIWLAQNRNTVNNQFDMITHEYERNRANIVGGLFQSGTSAFASTGRLTSRARSTTAIGQTANVGASALSGIIEQQYNDIAAIDKVNSIVAQTEDMRQRPSTACGTQSSTISQSNGKSSFTVKIIQSKMDIMRMVDDYFTRFGYAVRKMKRINPHNRERWTYIKTADCGITVNAPSKVEQDIRAIFDRGVTFWVNNDEVGDYTLDNHPIND